LSVLGDGCERGEGRLVIPSDSSEEVVEVMEVVFLGLPRGDEGVLLKGFTGTALTTNATLEPEVSFTGGDWDGLRCRGDKFSSCLSMRKDFRDYSCF